MICEDSGRPLLLGNAPTNTQPPQNGAQWADHKGYWESADLCCNNTRMIDCNNANEIYSCHKLGCNFLYGDCAVRFHNNDIDPGVFIALFSRAGKETVPIDFTK